MLVTRFVVSALVGLVLLSSGCLGSASNDNGGGNNGGGNNGGGGDDDPFVPDPEGYFWCDGTQSDWDWWVGLFAATGEDTANEVTVTIRQSSTNLGTFTMPYDSTEDGYDYWAGGYWEDEVGSDCDNVANLRVIFETDAGDTFEAVLIDPP